MVVGRDESKIPYLREREGNAKKMALVGFSTAELVARTLGRGDADGGGAPVAARANK